MTQPQHRPVMPAACMTDLAVKSDGIYVDATAGLGGHSAEIAALLGERGKLYSFEVDPQAAALCAEKLAAFGGKAELVNASYTAMKPELAARGVSAVDGVLFDFGVSSLQLDTPSRGFSLMADGPLDMRFGPQTNLTAAEIVATWPSDELARVFWEYGEERFSRRAAQAIVMQRQRAPITTTAQLRAVLERAVPRSGRTHPATRVFQALRICVNAELENVRAGLEAASGIMAPSGRICALSFHSLEDRIVKRFFAGLCTSGEWELPHRKPLLPTDEEIASNPRSRSAKLRAVMKSGARAAY